MNLGRRLSVALAATVLLGVLTTTASAQHVARGILFKIGEKLTTELTPSGDVDTFVFYGVEGVNVSLTLLPGTEGFSPTMTMLDENDNVLDLSAYTKVKGTKTKVRKYPLPKTGPYFLRVTDPLGRTGRYDLKTKGDMAAAPRLPKVTIGPGETYDVSFGASPGLTVDAKIKFMDRRKPVSVLSVHDPDGEEVPHGKGSFYRVSQGLLASMKMQSPARSSWRNDADVRRVGPYGLTIGGASVPTSFKVKLKVRHEPGSGKRVVASTVPVVTRCHPGFGRPGSRVIIHGANFLPGKIEVLFGDSFAREVRFLTPSTISVRSPYGEGEVDVTVFNADGQQGMLEDAYIFIPNPPNVGSVSPEEGPDNGGTVVDVFGEQFTWVEKAKIGDAEVGAPNVIADFHLQITTEAMAPGTYDLELTDKFDQKIVYPDAFTFVAAPVLNSMSPMSGGVGLTVRCYGVNFRPDHTLLIDGAPIPTTYWSPTQLLWTTPVGLPGDKITIGVRDIWGRTSTLATQYEYALSHDKIEEPFSNNVKQDTGFTPSDGGLALWNPKANPGKLVAAFGSDVTNIPSTHNKSVSSNVFPLNTSSMYVMKWYKSSDCGNAGTITGFRFFSGSSTPASGAVYKTFTVKMGHNKSSTGLTTSSPRTANFSGTPVTVINGVSYTLPTSMSTVTLYSYPTFSTAFSYNGSDHIVVDTSQAGGSRSQTWGVYSGYGKETYRVWGYPNTGTGASGSTSGYLYQCALDFRSDTSQAQSLFYRMESDRPDLTSPVVLPTTQPTGTSTLIEYQGAKENPASGTPDPLTYTPWTQDPTTLFPIRYLRFRVTFEANLDTGKGPAIDNILIPYTFFD